MHPWTITAEVCWSIHSQWNSRAPEQRISGFNPSQRYQPIGTIPGTEENIKVLKPPTTRLVLSYEKLALRYHDGNIPLQSQRGIIEVDGPSAEKFGCPASQVLHARHAFRQRLHGRCIGLVQLNRDLRVRSIAGSYDFEGIWNFLEGDVMKMRSSDKLRLSWAADTHLLFMPSCPTVHWWLIKWQGAFHQVHHVTRNVTLLKALQALTPIWYGSNIEATNICPM